jgi:hypothetical protein
LNDLFSLLLTYEHLLPYKVSICGMFMPHH